MARGKEGCLQPRRARKPSRFDQGRFVSAERQLLSGGNRARMGAGQRSRYDGGALVRSGEFIDQEHRRASFEIGRGEGVAFTVEDVSAFRDPRDRKRLVHVRPGLLPATVAGDRRSTFLAKFRRLGSAGPSATLLMHDIPSRKKNRFDSRKAFCGAGCCETWNAWLVNEWLEVRTSVCARRLPPEAVCENNLSDVERLFPSRYRCKNPEETPHRGGMRECYRIVCVAIAGVLVWRWHCPIRLIPEMIQRWRCATPTICLSA